MNYKHIDDLAAKALASIDCKEPPVPIEKIPEKFELKVIEFEFHEDISAVFKQQKGVIGVNKKHPLVRRRFSLAHELGHFLLGHAMDFDRLVEDEFSKADPREREANSFASAILMPSGWIKKSVAQFGLDLDKLSKLYLVSKQAMTIRLLELGLIK